MTLEDFDDIGLNDDLLARPSPFDAALEAAERLEINPLCSREHAEKLIRRDAAAIIRELERQYYATK